MKQKGFTLIELIIVVAIIGIILAVVLPNIGRFSPEADQIEELPSVIDAPYAVVITSGPLPHTDITYCKEGGFNITPPCVTFTKYYTPVSINGILCYNYTEDTRWFCSDLVTIEAVDRRL